VQGRLVIRRILLAVDTQRDAGRAVALAGELGIHLGATVTVLHVREWLLGPSGPFDDGGRRSIDLVQGVCERLRSRGLLVRCEIRSTYFAFTAQRIVEVASEQAADLIVLGPHRKGLSISAILGRDVTSAVLKGARVPVMIAA
jgi:nucleotide-binding universal stress UspA family protein